MKNLITILIFVLCIRVARAERQFYDESIPGLRYEDQESDNSDSDYDEGYYYSSPSDEYTESEEYPELIEDGPDAMCAPGLGVDTNVSPLSRLSLEYDE